MPSSLSHPNGHQLEETIIQNDSQVPYMVAAYLNAEPNIHEKIAAIVRFEEGGEIRERYYEDKAKKALDSFDKAWNNVK
ncbi:hypothetical protein F4814DRAFT_421459 [Daldinia grandis]|nr:hypothetical protein F4814DRAFT_421459 [Daldinia grandis]